MLQHKGTTPSGVHTKRKISFLFPGNKNITLKTYILFFFFFKLTAILSYQEVFHKAASQFCDNLIQFVTKIQKICENINFFIFMI